MKKAKYLVMIMSLSLLLTSTTCEDDNFYDKSIKIDNLIDVETNPNYNVGDIIYVNSLFSRYLPEEGYSNFLDIYKTTGSNKFGFNISLFKKDASNDWILEDLSQTTLLDKGEIRFNTINNYYDKNCLPVLNTSNNNYEFRVGIKLLDPGEYELSINTILSPIDIKNKVNLEIFTTIDGFNDDLNNDYSYTFIVN